MHSAPAELCESSLPLSLSGVVRFQFHVRASGYSPFDSADKPVMLEYLTANGGDWKCLGTTPCSGLTIRNIAPDAFGNEQHQYSSPVITLPVGQRGTAQVRLTHADGVPAPTVTQTTVQFFYR